MKDALIHENWDAIPANLTVKSSIETWAKGDFTVRAGDRFIYKGEELPAELNQRIIAMAAAGDDPSHLLKFWERLQLNPSYRSVKQLYGFLAQRGIPFVKDGCFLAYKGVTAGLKDTHSGKFDNKPGVVNAMERNKVSDDPEVACHEGFHVGAFDYAKAYGTRVVVCKIDPKDVVCVPYDGSQQKMRVCKYKVIGHHSGELLPDTIFQEDVDLTDLDVYEAHEQDVDEDAASKSRPRVLPKRSHKKNAKKKDRKKAKEPTKPVRFPRLEKLGIEELLKEQLTDLRKYATYGLLIVGASKIPGGKVALINKIMQVRS